MADPKVCRPAARLPSVALVLGAAGLLPPLIFTALMLGGPTAYRLPAVLMALCYASLILSFLGGTWWGLAAHSAKPAPRWVWLAAVAPSLIACAALGAVMIGQTPQPSLLVVGVSLVAALGVDYRLSDLGLCPPNWLRLRTCLSLALGGLTIFFSRLEFN